MTSGTPSNRGLQRAAGRGSPFEVAAAPSCYLEDGAAARFLDRPPLKPKVVRHPTSIAKYS